MTRLLGERRELALRWLFLAASICALAALAVRSNFGYSLVALGYIGACVGAYLFRQTALRLIWAAGVGAGVGECVALVGTPFLGLWFDTFVQAFISGCIIGVFLYCSRRLIVKSNLGRTPAKIAVVSKQERPNRAMRLSLRRLFLYLTLICIVLGAIATFPDAVELVVKAVGGSLYTAEVVIKLTTSLALFVGPAVVAGALFAWTSPNPSATSLITALGAVVGAFLSPAMETNAQSLLLCAYGMTPRWQAPNLHEDALPVAVAALIAGGLGWVIAFTAAHRRPRRVPGARQARPQAQA